MYTSIYDIELPYTVCLLNTNDLNVYFMKRVWSFNLATLFSHLWLCEPLTGGKHFTMLHGWVWWAYPSIATFFLSTTILGIRIMTPKMEGGIEAKRFRKLKLKSGSPYPIKLKSKNYLPNSWSDSFPERKQLPWFYS